MRTKATPASRRNGFTLIELMIVVVIIGILAAIAYPSYRDSVRKGRRASAESYLMDLAQRQQQYLMDARAYATDATTLEAVPAEVQPYYTVTTSAPAGATPPTFAVTATAIGDQVNDTSCTPLSITNTGAKSPSSCW
jgi:type IV pilus assembly protein PilE